MGNTKPKWGHSPISEMVDWDDEQKKDIISSIENLTDLTFTKNLAKRLIEVSQEYVSTHNTIDNYPGISNVKPALKKLNKSAQELFQILTGLDPTSRHYLRKQSDWIDIPETINRVEAILHASEDAIKSLPKPEKKRPKGTKYLAREVFITELIDIYKDVTGKEPKVSYNNYTSPHEPYCGEFFDFVDTCLKKINMSENNSALGSAIKRALNRYNLTINTSIIS